MSDRRGLHQRHPPARPGAHPRQAARPATHLQPQRHADDGGDRPEQLDDHHDEGRAEARADLRRDRRGQDHPRRRAGPVLRRPARRCLLRRLEHRRQLRHAARAPASWSASRSPAAARTPSAPRSAASSRAGASPRSSASGPTPSSCSPSSSRPSRTAPSTSSPSRSRSTRSARSTTSCSCWSRSRFPFGGEKKTDKSYLDRKAETVIEKRQDPAPFCDVYKAEFPGTLGHESDAQLEKNLAALNAASRKPWVLLSAGVDYPEYKKQVEMAMKAGASGVLGGRAFWKEYFQKGDQAAREKFAKTECVNRVKEIDEHRQEQGQAVVRPLRADDGRPARDAGVRILALRVQRGRLPHRAGAAAPGEAGGGEGGEGAGVLSGAGEPPPSISPSTPILVNDRPAGYPGRLDIGGVRR